MKHVIIFYHMNIFNDQFSHFTYYAIMDFLLSKYGVIFTEFDSIDRGKVYITPYLLSKMSITVLLYS